MKKLLFIGAMSALLLAACTEEEATPKEESAVGEETEVNEETSKKESEYPFPDSELMGDANIIISTPAGDSSGGSIPVLFVSKDDMIVQIGIDYEKFDGSVETYVYINKVFSEKVQAGELMQSSLDLKEDNLKPGEYIVTAVQFTDNDPTKAPFNITEAKFQIKGS